MERKNNEKRTGRLSNLSEVFQLSKEGKTLFSNPSFRFWQLQNKWKSSFLRKWIKKMNDEAGTKSSASFVYVVNKTQ